MKKYFLLTAFGKDRPGIIAGVTEVLFKLGGNIEDASMTRLGGEFTIMLVIALPPAVTAPKLEKELKTAAKKLALEIAAKPIPPRPAKGAPPADARFLISVYGTDRPGIVFEVTKALADRKVSVTDLNTKVLQQSGKPLYVMLLEIQTAPATDMDDLRAELDRLRRTLGVEITLQDIEAVAM